MQRRKYFISELGFVRPSLLTGAASAFDLFGRLPQYDFLEGQSDYRKTMALDWKQVGEDMQGAIDRYKQDR